MGRRTEGTVAEAGEKSGLATTTLGDRTDNRRHEGRWGRLSRDVACQVSARGVVLSWGERWRAMRRIGDSEDDCAVPPDGGQVAFPQNSPGGQMACQLERVGLLERDCR